jgi:DNA-directed RNA polymerase specialized sigma24 family protein
MLAHHYRTNRRRASLLGSVAQERAAHEPWHCVDPERVASARELLERLGARFNPKAQELLSQRYALGETTHEIATRLEQSPTAVRMRLMRLRSAAKGHLRSRSPA